MLELDNISLGYGRKVLLEAVSACFGAGECVALLGRNGAGKSTLACSGAFTEQRYKI